ncbi:hypothetical protein SLA2020_263650 [Shorea laevis]
MRKPRNVFVRFSLEADFIKAMSRESSEIDGVTYRNFQWTVDFSEDVEPVMAPVWIQLAGACFEFLSRVIPAQYYSSGVNSSSERQCNEMCDTH